jgi:hypothetical protein
MITKSIGFLPVLCLAALTLSCMAPQPEAIVSTLVEGDDIIAGIEAGAPATKTVVEDLNVLWSEGDLLSVFSNSTGNSEYTLKSGAGEASGVFKKVKGAASGEDYDGYVAVYPYDETVALDADGTVSLVLPATQTYVEDSFGPGANAMVAWSEDTHLSFFNVGSFLMLKLHGNACISSIELTALGGESLAGPVQVAQKDGVPVAEFTKDAEACPTVTLLCDEVVQLDEEEDTPFWIVVPPVILSEGFKVTVICEHGQVVELPYPKEAEFVRNQVFRMATAEVTVEKTYLDYLSEDYRTLAANYPNAKDHFVEARYVLNDIIADNEVEDLKAESVMLICYCWLEGYSEIDVFERNFTTGETDAYQYFADSPWLGDMVLSESQLSSLRFSLDDAIRNAKDDEEASAGDGLDTRNVTLRKPLWPVWENPQYVVGGSASRLDHVFVDAVNGKVSTLENDAGGGGSSLEYLMEDCNILRDMYWMDEILGFPLEIRDFIANARYTLNQPMNACQLGELYGKEVTYSFYVPASESVSDNYLIRGTRNLVKGFSVPIETEAEVFTGEWPTLYYLTPDERDNLISLEDAMYIVKLGNVTDPDTAEVLLCKTGANSNPVYIFFGNANPTIIVDGITGEFITE